METQAQSARQTASTRYRCMDGIKGVALIGIMWYHLSASTLHGGFIGVDMFFTVSGFLLGTGLLREIARDGQIDLRRFYLRRLVRLWPAMAFMVIAVVSLGLLIDRDLLVGIPGASLAALTFSSNWQAIASGSSYFALTSPQPLRHLWFVALLAQVTLILPLLVMIVHKFVPQRVRVIIPIALALLSAILMGVLYQPNADPTRVYFGTDTHCFGILFGLALAWAIHDIKQYGMTMPERIRPIMPWLATGALLALFALTLHVDQDASAFRGGLFAAALLTIVVICGSIQPDSWMNELFTWRPLALLGRYSYGVYLWHWPLFVMIQLMLPGWRGRGMWLIWILTLIASGCMAALSWWMIEQPFSMLIRNNRGTASIAPHDQAAPAASRVTSSALDGASVSFQPLAEAHALDTSSVVHTPQQVAAASALVSSRTSVILRRIVTVVVTVAAVIGFAFGVRVAPAKSRIQIELEHNQGVLNSQADKRASDAQAAKAAAEAKKRAEEAARKREQAIQKALSNLDGKQVSVVGDSVTVGASPALSKLLPGIVVDAQVSRSILKGPEVVSTLKAQGQLRKYVVVSLNTNSQSTAQDFDDIVNAAGDGHVFILVTAHGDRSWIPLANQAVFDYASAHAGNVTVADWNAVISEHPELLGSDGIHPGVEGQDLYAQTVKEAIAGWIADHGV